MRRVIIIVALGLLVPCGLAVGALLYARSSLVEPSGRTRIAALSAAVEIVRDEHAIPHVFARTVHDAYLGLGYAHAQDRLWQLELQRRLGSGTLAEVVGARALEADKLFRTLGLARAARENYATLAPETRDALDAYTAGINAFLAESHRLPPEFALMGIDPAPWRATDSLTILKLMGWRLSGNWDSELWRVRLGAQLTPQQLAEYTTPQAGTPAIAYQPLFELYEQLALPHVDAGLPKALRTIASELRRFAPSNFGMAVGSNNWALDGAHTASGKPLLANDPHLALTAPSQWYFAHLDAPGLRVIGATIPGLPGVILGRNERVAWAFTNTLPDTQDVYLEQVADGSGDSYRTPQGTQRFGYASERIRVKGAADVELTVRSTRHGPVISDLTQVARESVPAGHVLALAWTGLRSDDRTLSFPVRAARAASASELRDAARDFHTPAQNIVYADTAGAIGFVAAGRVPLRAAENALRGLVPSPGWLAEYDWQGLVPFEELPQHTQPERGRIVTANQDIRPPGYATWLGADWGPSYRADRIESLLAARATHDLASFTRIQADQRSAIAEQLVTPMLAALGEPRDDVERFTQTELRAWDRVMRADASAPLLFAAWLRELSRGIYQDELGALFPQEWSARPEFLAHVLTDVAGQARWCDDVRSEAAETCATQARASLRRAVATLRERFGKDPQSWRWGRAHQTVAQSPIFGGVPGLSRLYNLSIPRGGDSSTIDVGSYELEDDAHAFESSWGPGFRAVYDLSDLDRSVGILNSGQSGHVMSPHYRDMLQPWARGEHVTLTTERAALHVLGTWRLEPGRDAPATRAATH